MQISITFEPGEAHDVSQLALRIGGYTEGTEDAKPAPKKRGPAKGKGGRPRKTKTKTEGTEKRESIAADPAVTPDPEPTPEPEAPAGEMSLEDVRGLMKQYYNAQGGDAALALLKQFEVKRVADLPKEKYAEFARVVLG
jgi:hypothetical protein